MRLYHARVMETAFRNPDGRSRQECIRETRVGTRLSCHRIKDGDGHERIALHNTADHRLGFLDESLVRELTTLWVGHPITVSVERVEGGAGSPYVCRVCIYIHRVRI